MPIDDWASDADFPEGSSPWSSQPTKVEPTAGIKVRGFLPGDKPPAQWFNWLFHTIITAVNGKVGGSLAGAADNTVPRTDDSADDALQGSLVRIDDSGNVATPGEYNYDSAKIRTIVMGGAEGHGTDITGTSNWSLAYSPASGAIGASRLSQANNAALIFPLALPTGVTVTQIRALWDPGATGRTNKLRAEFRRSDAFDASPDAHDAAIATVNQTETTSPEVRSMTGLSTVIDRSAHYYYVVIIAGEDGSSSPDRVYSIEVTYTDPGPRSG